MKILVTGSSGFIGFHLVRRLLADGHEITGIDNHNDYYDKSLKIIRKKKLKSPKFKFIEKDINKINAFDEDYDVAINLAARPGVRTSKEKEYLYDHSNIKGFKNFCRLCMNKNIKNLIYASSSSVYSDLKNEKFSEKATELSPKSKYGETKLENERYAKAISLEKGVNCLGLRFFSVYGPYGRPDMAYFLFTESIKKGEMIKLNNAGNMLRDMTYIDDIIDGIIGSIKYITSNKFSPNNQIFNLGNDQPIKTKEMLRFIEKKLSKKAIVKISKTTNEAKYTHADITKAKKLLSFNPNTSFSKGMEIFLEWHDRYEKK